MMIVVVVLRDGFETRGRPAWSLCWMDVFVCALVVVRIRRQLLDGSVLKVQPVQMLDGSLLVFEKCRIQ